MNSQNKFRRIVFVALLSVVLLVNYQCVGGSSETSSKESKSVGNKSGYPKLAFTKEIHKFGEISVGEIAICEFYFKNEGTANLIISKIETSCGCTNVTWDKKPIEPGQESKISVEFDSHGRYGKQYKVVTLFCNTLKKTKELVITAEVGR